MADAREGEGLALRVAAARKDDAGRGIARLPSAAMSDLGVISGDTAVVEGEGATTVKLWPAGPDLADDEIGIDADTRANAGAAVGDVVAVRERTVPAATEVVVEHPVTLTDATRKHVRRVATNELLGRPVEAGEQLRIERLADEPFRVAGTEPDGPVRITEDTEVRIARTPWNPEEGVEPSGGEAASGPERRSGVTYEDIGGLDDELDQVRETIELPLREPGLFRDLGVDPPKGVLLYGPPGTGKTLIAKAVANEVDAHFVSVSGPEIVSKYKGESEQRLREIFEEAEENAPTIVFFDEIDSVAPAREDDGGAENRIVAQLLSLMDGLETRGDVVVVGATNRVDAIDPALRRGGRFDREIEIGVPDEAGRREILAVHTRRTPVAEDVDLDRLAARTHGFVGADLDALTTEAAMAALRRARGETAAADADDPDREAPTVTRADFEAAMATVEPSAMREYVAETPDASFADVGGLEEAKRTLREAVQWPLRYANLFEATATEPPTGVLLYGPPGTGKTLLARALAGESEVNFIHVAGPEVVDRYVGESEKAIREVFDRARQAAPSIVFFDEIDALATRRGEGHDVTERIVSQLLSELDGMAENPNVVVLAATNRRDAIDPALLRPGRLDTHVEVPAPDARARREILAVHARDKPLADDVSLDEVAAETVGHTGADLAAVVREASMRAIREAADRLGPGAADDRADEITITAAHFAAALDEVEPTGAVNYGAE